MSLKISSQVTKGTTGGKEKKNKTKTTNFKWTFKKELHGNSKFVWHEKKQRKSVGCVVFFVCVFFLGGGKVFASRERKKYITWEEKHFHKYNKYHFWSKSKVRCRVFYLNKNNLHNNALNINKSISGQRSKININTLIYILFLAAKVINLLANVTVSQKSYFLSLVLWLTWEKDWVWKTVLQLYVILPVPPMTNRILPGHVFNMPSDCWFGEQLSRKK